MTRRVFLHLEALENRLTPTTTKGAAVIFPAARTTPLAQARMVLQMPAPQIGVTGSQSLAPVGAVRPAIGVSLGGGTGGNSSGGGGIGGTTGDPAGPGPGN